MATLFGGKVPALRSVAIFLVFSMVGIVQPVSGNTVTFGIGADDYASLTINGTQVALYNPGFPAAGGANGTFNMNPGTLYNITIVYKNTTGTAGLDLSWDQPGDAVAHYGSSANALAPNVVPLADLFNSSASGLVGTFSDLSGNGTVVVSGLGPIDYGPPPAPWPAYGYFQTFQATFNGQIMLPTPVPLPSTFWSLAALSGLLLLGKRCKSTDMAVLPQDN